MPTLSVEEPQLSLTDELVMDEAVMEPGVVGGVLSGAAWAVAPAGAEGDDSDPTNAVTWYVCVESGLTEVSSNFVPEVVAIAVAPPSL